MVSNLLDNAVKCTKAAEGNIIVMIRKDGEEEVSNNNNQWVIVSIRDTGTGIDSQILPRLFTKFATKPIWRCWFGIIHMQWYRRSSWWQNVG